MKLALGTVQFGTAYGAFNGENQVRVETARQILDTSFSAGVTTLDTASAYGNSEAVLGELGAASRFQIVSKIPALPESTRAGDHVADSLTQSLEQLGSESVSALMVHHADDLIGVQGDAMWSALERAQVTGKVDRIGASVYTTEQVDLLLDRYPIQIVQLPYSVFDQRVSQSGALDRLKRAQVEVHVRSVFLQGFALADPRHLPPHLVPFRSHLVAFQERAESNNLTPLEAALALPRDDERIDAVVVGVQSLSEWQEILMAWNTHVSIVDFSPCASADVNFVNPGNWRPL